MKKKPCTHKWQIVPKFDPQFFIACGGGGVGGAVKHVDVIAVCQKCLEKRYL